MRSLWQYYLTKETSLLYLHNVVDERTEVSLEGVRAAALMMKTVNARFIWVLFNKQDLLPSDGGQATLAFHRHMFETELSAHAPDVQWQFVDLPGFSARTGNRCSELLDIIHDTTVKGTKSNSGLLPTKSSQPTNKLDHRPSRRELLARIKREREASSLETSFGTIL